jgi:hypothetical protein
MYSGRNLKINITGMIFLDRMVNLLMMIKTRLTSKTTIKWMMNLFQNMGKILLIYLMLMGKILQKINQIRNSQKKHIIIKSCHIITQMNMMMMILIYTEDQMMTLEGISQVVVGQIIIDTIRKINLIILIIFMYISTHMKKEMKIKDKMINKYQSL